MSTAIGLDLARTVADAVLYEGYLLYPYRATSEKNLLRWQFGVLGPRGAERAGLGEAAGLSMTCLLRAHEPSLQDALTVHIRFLQVQRRQVQQLDPDGGFTDVGELWVDGQQSYSWDEAVEIERAQAVTLDELTGGRSWTIAADAGEDVEELRDHRGALVGRLIRRRWPTTAAASARLEPPNDVRRLTLTIDNTAHLGDSLEGPTRDDVLRRSLMGTHVIITSDAPGVRFVSVIDPPADAAEAAATCRQQRCWPVLVGPPGEDSMVLGSPIILYDYPEIAEESKGALFDSCEIDEILTLRVMTMTEQEKAEARATDPKAAEIIDRCDRMTVDELQQLHGVLRNPHAVDPVLDSPFDPGLDTSFDVAVDADGTSSELSWFDTADQPWWDPATDARVQPEVDAVMIGTVSVSKGSLVKVHPSRRADAQDLFFADQVARVTQVLSDVDGGVHVAVVLVDDPAADLHDWYGRYLYFAPDELEPWAETTSSSEKEK